MLPQEKIIRRLRRICQQDSRLVAAMLYGSFVQQEADEFSDIDCALFFDDEHLTRIDQKEWVNQIAPIELYYVNEFGNGVAIFNNLVRGEFHFDPASKMHEIESWRGNASFPSVAAALLVDRNGKLAQHLQALVDPPSPRDTPEEALHLCHSFLNWMLFGSNVLARGEYARALELLTLIHDYLLRMVRLVEGQTRHWITPTKALEREISKASYERFAACTAPAEPEALWHAYIAAWEWGNELMLVVAQRYDLALPTTLIEALERRLLRYAGRNRS